MATPALAAQTSNAEFVIIPEGDVLEDDLYAAAIRVVVEGTIDGDLIAFAAEEVVIEGTVTGSVLALTPRITVNGAVEGSLRFAATTLSVQGTVGGDLVGTAWETRLAAESEVEGEVLVWSWDADLEGTIGSDLSGSQRHLALSGEVVGDVDVSVGTLLLPSELRVGGDSGYRSASPAQGLERATVDGAVVEKSTLPPNLRVRALGMLGRFLAVLFLALSALTVAYGWPRRTDAAVARVGSTPVRNWLRGAVVLFSPLLVVLATVLLLILAPAAAALPLLAVLVPLILALLGLSFAVTLIAGIPVVGWVGRSVLRRGDLYRSLLAGSILAGVVWFLPFVGWIVPLLVLPLGLGAWMGAWGQRFASERASISSARSL
jgi:cytoskeletal protein CcmA (bactofilin family)